jgi:RimJ/RimL family protein N-acetyltransferase
VTGVVPPFATSQATYVLVPELRKPAMAPGSLSRHAQPRLQVDDLLLRPWHADDAEALARAYSDPSIQRWHVRSMNQHEALEWVHSRADRWEQETGADWAVVRQDVAIGRVGLRKLDLLDGVGEATYWVTPAARGQGVACRSLRAMSQWFFARGDFHRIELEHSTVNAASCRVALRAGFAAEGTRRQAVLHADGWHDMHLHARLSTDVEDAGHSGDISARPA